MREPIEVHEVNGFTVELCFDPDLLRDLKAIIEANPEWEDDLPEYMARARQSIAKAEGREQ